MNIARRIKETSQLTGRFKLRSGKISDTYFDKYLFESDPVLLAAITKSLAELIPPETEILAGLEMGGIPVATALSLETGLPAAYIRKERKEYGTAKYAEGPDLVGKNVLIIEDVVSSGGAILDSLQMLRKDGVEPHTALCVIDRETGGFEALRNVGVQLKSTLKMSEVLSA